MRMIVVSSVATTAKMVAALVVMVASVMLWCGDGDGDEVVRRWWRWERTCVGAVVFASAAGNLAGRDGGTRNEARIIGETLVLNRSLDTFFEDYIELNDLSEPLELRRDQVDDLMSTIEECEVVEEFRAKNDARMDSNVF
nr:hypothetical protein [Tanacetum cinerariifolium]